MEVPSALGTSNTSTTPITQPHSQALCCAYQYTTSGPSNLPPNIYVPATRYLLYTKSLWNYHSKLPLENQLASSVIAYI